MWEHTEPGAESQSEHWKVEYARSGGMEPHTDIYAIMSWHECAWHKQQKQYLGEAYLSASQRPKCKIHSTAD